LIDLNTVLISCAFVSIGGLSKLVLFKVGIGSCGSGLETSGWCDEEGFFKGL